MQYNYKDKNMVNAQKRQVNHDVGVVYDISLDGTVVNALGMNVMSNTDGFNFQMPPVDKFRYTEEHPYISNGKGRNSVEGKAYTGVDADVAEFEDMYLCPPFTTGINKMGLGVDEYCPATINFSRKNYADLLADGSVKLVGNSIKSKKMPKYIENFLNKGIRLLLEGKGYEFLEAYYDYIEKIYNMRIPLKEIASVGKIKTTLEAYKESCKQLTAGGQRKPRQAWYELAILDNLDVHMGDAIYFINTGKKKNDGDTYRIDNFYRINSRGEKCYNATDTDGNELLDRRGNPIPLIKYVSDQYTAYRKANKGDVAALGRFKGKWAYGLYLFPDLKSESRVELNCVRLSNEIVEDEDDHFCDDQLEYNREKYIDGFNKKVKPLLVCFSEEIRYTTDKKGNRISNILITNPSDRKFFTREETVLISGQPYQTKDQDTFEQLMSMEDKEIKFWLSVNKRPPYAEECGIDWDAVVADYNTRMKEYERAEVATEVREFNRIVDAFTKEDLEALFEDGTLPEELWQFADEDVEHGAFVSKKYGVRLGTMADFYYKDFTVNSNETED